MRDFDNADYSILISNLINDTQYINISNSGKMGNLRKHAEILVRKILNIGSDYQLMLGQVRHNSSNQAVANGLSNLGNTALSNTLIQTVNNINQIAREGAHTQRVSDFTDEEVSAVEDYILDLYAFLFIKFFTDYNVDLYFSSVILRDFSFLPPIIRYKTWNYLYSINKNNLQVANKLCLAIIKTYGKEAAYKWLKDNETDIKSIPYPTSAEIYKYAKECGLEITPGHFQVSLKLNIFNNMYDLLLDKINDPNTSINEKGKMYSNFEEAVEYLNNSITVYENTPAYTAFSSLIQFVFLGRKPKSELNH